MMQELTNHCHLLKGDQEAIDACGYGKGDLDEFRKRGLKEF